MKRFSNNALVLGIGSLSLLALACGGGAEGVKGVKLSPGPESQPSGAVVTSAGGVQAPDPSSTPSPPTPPPALVAPATPQSIPPDTQSRFSSVWKTDFLRRSVDLN